MAETAGPAVVDVSKGSHAVKRYFDFQGVKSALDIGSHQCDVGEGQTREIAYQSDGALELGAPEWTAFHERRGDRLERGGLRGVSALNLDVADAAFHDR